MAQRCGGRVCPSHTHVGQGLQETRNNVPTTEKEKKPVSGANYTLECSTNLFSYSDQSEPPPPRPLHLHKKIC